MAINTQKLLPGSGSTTKALPQAKITTIPLTSEDKKKVNTIRVKTIQVDKILKGTLAADKKRLSDKKKAASQQRRQKQESELEKKPEKNKKFKMPKILPRMGIWDWIKNFIGSIILGYFAYNMIDHADKLKGTLTTILNITDFVIDWGGKLFNGLVTFIDWGYNLHDWTKGITEKLGIEGSFTHFINNVDKLITLLIAIAAINALTPNWAKGGRLKGQKPQGPKGKPRSWQNKGWRLPWQKPKVSTGTGGKPKMPKWPGSGPKVTTGGAKPNKGVLSILSKIPGLGSLKGVLGKALGPLFFLLDFGGRKGAGQTNVQAGVGAGASQAGFWGGSALAATKLSPLLVTPVPGARILYGVGVLGAGLLGSFGLTAIADTATGANKVGQVEGKSEGGVVNKKKKRFYKIKRPVYEVYPSSIDFPDAGDEKEGEKKGIWGWLKEKVSGIFKWVTNPLGQVWRTMGDKFLKVKFFGPILTLAIKSFVGQSLTKKDYDDAGLGIASLLNKGLNDEDLTGNLMAAFAAGGLVSPLMEKKQKNVADWISQQLQDSLQILTLKTANDVKKAESDTAGDGTRGPAGGSGPAGGNITGESGPVSGTDQQKAKMMYEYLMTKPGMTHNKAAGIVANIKFESGFRTDVMGDSGTSGGLFQMHAGRLTSMENAVPNWRNNWKGQIDYALKDDRGPEYMNMTFDSAGDAANWWMRNWERPAQEVRDTREHNQRQWIKKINWQGKSDPVRGTSKGSKGPGLFPLDPSQMPDPTYSSGIGGDMVPSEKGTRTSGELGKFLKEAGVGSWGSGVWQHPWFGGSPRRSYPSWHNVDRALDIGGYWPEDQRQILPKIAEFNAKHGVKPVELLYGKSGTPKADTHKDHVHVAYHKGGEVPGKGERWAKLLGGEMVIDVDSAGPAKNLLLAINQASGPQQVMKAIQDYAPYEALASRMIPIPIPVPTGGSSVSSSRPTTIVVGGGGRTHDPFESLVAQG